MSAKLKHFLKNFLQSENFNPRFLGLFLNPFYFARSSLWAAVKSHANILKGDLLDVGCGSKPYQSLLCVNHYVGLDIDLPDSRARAVADFFYDGSKFPFPDKSFDSVICNQVLEHVFNPENFLQEIRRVLKPGGILLLTVPFVWDEHEQPHDFARYSSFGVKHLFNITGFELIYLEKLGDDITTIFQLLNGYIYKKINVYPRLLRIMITVSLIALINLIGVIARFLTTKNADLYLDNFVIAKRPL